jgi:hypothetical protein
MRMTPWIAAGMWLFAASSTAAAVTDGEDPVALVALLALDGDPRRPGGGSDPVEARLAALGVSAVAALECEMHLELRGRERQKFIDSGESRRYAVIRVLGRIKDARSTAVLISAIRAYGDFNGLCDAVVHELRSMSLAAPDLELLLRSESPAAVQFALQKAGTIDSDSPLRTAAMDLYDGERLGRQFHDRYGNRHGPNPGGEEILWEIRLSAGRALGKDMAAEMRARAVALLAELLAVPRSGWKGTGRTAWPSSLSDPEFEVHDAIRRLVRLGPSARTMVEEARKGAPSEEADLLDVALLALGDGERLTAVAAILTDSPNASLRLCAAMFLRSTKDARTRAAWWKALEDPYHCPSRGCVRIPGEDEVYPVRRIAADALIELGEPPKVVRAKAHPVLPGKSPWKEWALAGLAALGVLWLLRNRVPGLRRDR